MTCMIDMLSLYIFSCRKRWFIRRRSLSSLWMNQSFDSQLFWSCRCGTMIEFYPTTSLVSSDRNTLVVKFIYFKFSRFFALLILVSVLSSFFKAPLSCVSMTWCDQQSRQVCAKLIWPRIEPCRDSPSFVPRR